MKNENDRVQTLASLAIEKDHLGVVRIVFSCDSHRMTAGPIQSGLANRFFDMANSDLVTLVMDSIEEMDLPHP